MKKLLITYDTVDVDDTQGETCCELDVSDFWAKALLDDDSKTLKLEFYVKDQPYSVGTSFETATLFVESILHNSEFLKNRSYVYGSIKDIRLIF